MAQPAARVGDLVAHKGKVPGLILEGSPDVRIGGMPAARLGDLVQHAKAVETLAQGEPTVRINGKIAVRLGDEVNCTGVVVAGCASVRIGLHPQGRCLQAAARQGSALVEATGS
jgi:uncharacterized Zn-binding protein involved in type VI secretion